MWTKTRQILESRLADSLKKRVHYTYDVYRTKGCKQKPHWFTETLVFTILVDKKPWFCSNPRFYFDEVRKGQTIEDDNDVIKQTGFVPNDTSEITYHIHNFLNVLSIDESFENDNYFIRLLALLDKKIGKRRIQKLVDNIDKEPEWFRKWILLRAEELNQKIDKE